MAIITMTPIYIFSDCWLTVAAKDFKIESVVSTGFT
jgi:hypothetical protein